METLNEIFPVILYGLLIILVIVLIILGIKIIKTLNKVDNVVDDVNGKVKSLNGLFSIIDTTTDALSGFGDKFVSIISCGINSLFTLKSKKAKERDEEDE